MEGAVLQPLDATCGAQPLALLAGQSLITLGRIGQDVELCAGSTLHYISRKHATLSLSKDGASLFLNDTSSNGTLLNGALLKNQTAALKDGDLIVSCLKIISPKFRSL